MASQFMYSPLASHTEAIDRILLYLKLTPSKGILFQNTRNRNWKLTVILIGMDQLLIEVQLLDIVPSCEEI